MSIKPTDANWAPFTKLELERFRELIRVHSSNQDSAGRALAAFAGNRPNNQ